MSARETLIEAYLDLLLQPETSSVTVTELCSHTGYNRSTFYRNFETLEDLEREIRIRTESHFQSFDLLHHPEHLDLWLEDIETNRNLYFAYMKLGFHEKHPLPAMDPKLYHRALFFAGGLRSLFEAWAKGRPDTSVMQMKEAIRDYYRPEQF